MQSFIINIPDEKVDFFLELAEMLDFEVLEIEEDEFDIEADSEEHQDSADDQSDADDAQTQDDPFLDWDAERQNAKKHKY